MQHYHSWKCLYSLQQDLLYQLLGTSSYVTYPRSSEWWREHYFATTNPGQTSNLPTDVVPITPSHKHQSLAISKLIGTVEPPYNTSTPVILAPPTPPPAFTLVFPQLLHQHELEETHPHLWSSGDLNFLIYLCTIPDKWERDLFTAIVSNVPWNHPHFQTENPLQSLLITGKGPIYIISDAAMDGTWDSAFHWVIAIFYMGIQMKLWSGNDPVPGPASQAHTSWSKGYGALSALRFLYHFIKFYGIATSHCNKSGYSTLHQSVLLWQPGKDHKGYWAALIALPSPYIGNSGWLQSVCSNQVCNWWPFPDMPHLNEPHQRSSRL